MGSAGGRRGAFNGSVSELRPLFSVQIAACETARTLHHRLSAPTASPFRRSIPHIGPTDIFPALARLLLVVRRKKHQPTRAVAATCAPVFPRLSLPRRHFVCFHTVMASYYLLRLREDLILLKDIDPVTAYRISQRPPRSSSSSHHRHPDFLR